MSSVPHYTLIPVQYERAFIKGLVACMATRYLTFHPRVE